MPIPTYQEAMLPLLKFAGDQQEHSLSDATKAVSDAFRLTESERNELLQSGRKPIIADRVGWARTYLGQAGLLQSTRRGFFRISDRGLSLLSTNPISIDDRYLRRYPEFVEFLSRKTRKRKTDELPTTANETNIENENTPEEALESSFQVIRNRLASEVLEQVKSCSPNFFERLVVDLLVAMGYGGMREAAGQAVGQSGDGGIDGIIKEDQLGLDVIYLQAKRWEGNVSRPEIQKFAGALQGKRAKKGVFITTSDFTKEAREFAAGIDNKLILIDGLELAEYMIDFNVGTSTVNTYEIKRIDSDYFIEE
ncbi:MAG TPA: restriction endonuclease [Pyrinomonadaceae bacterium]|nr:restriction endonuclease [Pyrinomonadaceae bacterium]